MYIDRQRIRHAAQCVASAKAYDASLVARVHAIIAKSYHTEFFSTADVLTLERIELAEMGIDGVSA